MTYTGPRTEMIERVAKAIRDSEYGVGSTEPHEDFMDDAYAAISAMRDYSDDMLAPLGNGECAKWAPGAWITMIDAALGNAPTLRTE